MQDFAADAALMRVRVCVCVRVRESVCVCACWKRPQAGILTSEKVSKAFLLLKWNETRCEWIDGGDENDDDDGDDENDDDASAGGVLSGLQQSERGIESATAHRSSFLYHAQKN